MYLFYGLSNFYQNHRRYVRSRDDNQLKGDVIDPGSLNADCDPYRTANSSTGYAPCGAIANSLFNGKCMGKGTERLRCIGVAKG